MADQPIRVDVLLPVEVAHRAEEGGVAKACMSLSNMFVLAVLAGGFVGLGAEFFTTILTGATDILPFGLARLLPALAFCVALILIVLAGAELFTGNTLITIAWASRKVSTGALLRNWAVVYAGNLAGATATAVLIFLSRQYTFGGGSVGRMALTIANAKVNLDFTQALVLGMLCNALVCLAVWLTMGAHTTTDKILAILFPITAFACMGFEHSVANMFFIPMGLLIKQFDPAFIAKLGLDLPNLTFAGYLSNLIPVTIGNIFGGAVMVAAVYWFVYLRPQASAAVRR